MNFSAAHLLAQQLLAHHHLHDWSFAWNRRKRALGLCRYREKRIELSAHFVAHNDEPQIRETLLHEIAHALAGEKAGHGPRWKAMCAKVGCKPERCDKGEARMPPGRWTATCPTCNKTYSRHRRPQKSAHYWCPPCGPAKGPIHFCLNLPAHSVS